MQTNLIKAKCIKFEAPSKFDIIDARIDSKAIRSAFYQTLDFSKFDYINTIEFSDPSFDC